MSAADISAVGAASTTVGSQRVEETLNSTVQSDASYVPTIVKPVAVKRPVTNIPVIPPSPSPLAADLDVSQPNISDCKQFFLYTNCIDLIEFANLNFYLLIHLNPSVGRTPCNVKNITG